MTGPERGILVVRGDVDHGLTYSIRRGDGVTLGEDEIVALSPENSQLTSVVRRLASRPTPDAVGALAEFGVEYVVLPSPADASVAAGLDATGGLTQASAERGTRAWQVARALDPGAVDGSASCAADLPARAAGPGDRVGAGAVRTDRESEERMSESSPPSPPPPSPGRRVAGAAARRPDITVVLAVLLPLVTVGALLLVRPDIQGAETEPPQRTELTRSTIVCPGGASRTYLSTTSETSGKVIVRVGKGDEKPVDLSSRALTDVSGSGAAVATGEGALAPGLVGGVFDSPLAAAACSAPLAEQWFTGLGAGARHSSVLELVNPDAGPAVVDATLIGQSGVVDAPALRGVAVPAHGEVRIDLATTIPRRDELSLRVTTSRGRVSATVRDRYDQLGAGASARDWMPGQPAPSTSNLLLGLAPGSGQRNLVLTNPGLDETRAKVQVVTKESVFSPKGVDEVILAPEAVTRVSLSKLLDKGAMSDALGLLITSPRPVTATVRSFVDRDLSHAGAGMSITDSTVLTPTGRKQVVLAGADGAGTVTILATDAAGEKVLRRRFDVSAGRGFSIPVPAETTMVDISTRGTSVGRPWWSPAPGQRWCRSWSCSATAWSPRCGPGS